MRFLELLLLLLGVLLPFYISSKKANINHILLLIVVLLILIGHAILEGIRWQMSPIYLVHFVILVCLIKRYFFFKGGWFRQISSGLTLFLMLGLGFVFSKFLPVFELPNLTGKYSVGSQYLHYISKNEEYISVDKFDKRELMIKAWYPAKITGEPKEPYLDKGERVGFAAKYGLPKNTFNYLDQIKTNTFQNPAVAAGTFPVLIFTHGYYSNATGYYALIEEIVSNGFIVLNINHTYESVGALFPSGKIKLYDKAYDSKHNNEAMAKMVWEAMEDFKKANSMEEKRKAIDYVLKNYYASEITNRWEQDINEIVNQIPVWNNSSFLANHINTSKIGVFGHSQGGAAAGQALLNNAKIVVGINIDGVQWGNMVDTFQSKPFLLLSSDWPAEHPDFNEVAFRNGSADFYVSKIKNTGHSSFMDIPFMIDLPIINEAGDIEPKKAIEITANLIVAFFNKYLNNQEVDLLKLANEHPALVVKNESK